jgi:hypothetical protein
MRDGKAFGAEIVSIVKGYMEKSLASILVRLDALEKVEQPKAVKGDPGEPGTPGRDGKDGSDGKDAPAPTAQQVIEALRSMPEAFDAAVQRYLEQHPPAAGKDGEPGKPGKDGAPGKDGEPGRDGVGVASALIDRAGNLVITCSNGATCELGAVVGKNGDPGRDGRDGFSLSNFDATLMDDGRTVLFSFEGADQSFAVELAIPAMIYRGVWREDQAYERGDTVTWAGSLWHCDADDTSEKPDGSEKHWTLAAKRGRDGKDASVKPEKALGPLRVGVPAGEA